MMYASFTYQLHTEHYGERGFLDPTNLEKFDGSRSPMETVGTPLSPIYRYAGSDWMAKLSFLFQLPRGFNFSCFANARQGLYFAQTIRVPIPERQAVGLEETTVIHTEKFGRSRLPDFYNVDLSLVKDISIRDYGRVSLSIDAFNIFNFSHTLDRYPQVNSARHDEIQKILNPRVIRLGIRYSY